MKGADRDIRSGWLHGRQGRYGLMRRHFRRFIGRDPEAGPFSRFLALMSLKEYGPAFEMAEASMEALQPVEREQFHRPWPDEWLRSPRLAPKVERFYRGELLALARWSRRHPGSHWPGFFIGCIHWRLRSVKEALARMEPLKRLPEKRYGWLRYFPGILRLTVRDYPGAVRDLSAALRSCPGFWHARCHLAEALLCMGAQAAAFRQFERAAADDDSGHVLAWRAEALLWLGEYEKAKDWLDRAAERGGRTAYCWRGACLMLLGDRRAALRDLDAAVAIAPGDAEALRWRGELKRLLGRWEEALEDLGRSISLDWADSWARCNRALVWAAVGRPGAMRADFKLMPRGTRDAVLAAMGLRSARTDQEIEEVLRTSLDLAGGVRRGEAYVQDVWLRRLARGAAAS